MIGIVDDKHRALLDVLVSTQLQGSFQPITAWIDTAFDGHLVFPLRLIEELQLEPLVETEAILADGRRVALNTFVCFVDWFGKRTALPVIANEGHFPLLGTALLKDRVLLIDYANRTLRVN